VHKAPIKSQSIEEMTNKILEFDENTKIEIYAPIIRGEKGTHKDLLEDLISKGFTKIKIDGNMHNAGDEVVLEITEQKYFAKYYDNVDTVQSIKGVMENDMKQSAKELKLEADKFVAKKLAEAVEAGTIAKSASAITPNKSNVVEAVEAGLVALYENNVDPSTEVWGELSPKMYSHMRQHLTELATNNIELMKKGIIGRYNNVNVTIENLLPTKSTVRYNFLRTGKAFAFAEQIDQIKAVEKERGFGDIVKGLYVFGGVVVRAKEAYAIQETI
jgi:hypothetical protein